MISPGHEAQFARATNLFLAAHQLDPNHPESVEYHQSLDAYVRKLCSAVDKDPSEALLLAANSQHIRRWEKPRKDWPEGLSGYKTWRAVLNRFHADVAEAIMLESGYSAVDDADVIKRVRDLLLKTTLSRPPLVYPLKDPEMHLFEDAICLVFLALQFTDFASKLDNGEKMVGIVKKTWAKMSDAGRAVAVTELVPTLSDEMKEIVRKGVS